MRIPVVEPVVEKDVVEKEGALFLDFDKIFVNHRRSRNYVAHITSFHHQYRFARDFLQKWKRTMYDADDFEEGEIYEIKAVYYTNSGRPNVKHHGFYRFEGIEDVAYFEELEEDDVYAILKQRNEYDEDYEEEL